MEEAKKKNAKPEHDYGFMGDLLGPEELKKLLEKMEGGREATEEKEEEEEEGKLNDKTRKEDAQQGLPFEDLLGVATTDTIDLGGGVEYGYISDLLQKVGKEVRQKELMKAEEEIQVGKERIKKEEEALKGMKAREQELRKIKEVLVVHSLLHACMVLSVTSLSALSLSPSLLARR